MGNEAGALMHKCRYKVFLLPMYGIHYKTVHLFRTEVLIKKQVANRTSVHVIFLKVRHKCADRFILTTGSLIIQPDIFPIYNPISSFNCRIDNASRPDGSLSGNSTTTGRTGRQVPSFSFLQSSISGCPESSPPECHMSRNTIVPLVFFHPRYLRQYPTSRR